MEPINTTTLRLVPRRGRPGDAGASSGARTLTINVCPDTRLLLSVEEAAERLDIGRTMLYELIAAGEVQTIHVGRLHKVPVVSLHEYVDGQRNLGPSSRTDAG